jgi:hypothetical protein
MDKVVERISEEEEAPDHCVLVEAPADPEFLAQWLLAAAKAKHLFEDALGDQDFAREIDRLLVWRCPDFGLAALELICELKDRWIFVLRLDSELGEEAVPMVGMGSSRLPRTATA